MLSRARHGMYILGHPATLLAKSRSNDMWPQVKVQASRKALNMIAMLVHVCCRKIYQALRYNPCSERSIEEFLNWTLFKDFLLLSFGIEWHDACSVSLIRCDPDNESKIICSYHTDFVKQ